jgi:predicted site-specific integrase-resolvase
MKSFEVLRLLHITRPTLTKYVKSGIIKVTKLPNGQYDYDTDSVYNFLNKDVRRKTYIYARVSTQKQKPDLDNQIELLKQFCFVNGYQVSGIFSDIASGISFEKRKDFFSLLDEVLDNKVERIVITYKDRLSRVGFDLFYHLFQRYNCEIVVIPCFNGVETKQFCNLR